MTKLTQDQARFIADSLSRAFPDTHPSVYTNMEGDFCIEYMETPEGAPFPREKYISHAEDFGTAFKEICLSRIAHTLIGRSL